MIRHDLPNNVEIDDVVGVTEEVAKVAHLPPARAGCSGVRYRVEPDGGLADAAQTALDGRDNKDIRLECLRVEALRELPDVLDVVQDLLKALRGCFVGVRLLRSSEGKDPLLFNSEPNSRRPGRLLDDIDGATQQLGEAGLNSLEPVEPVEPARPRPHSDRDVNVRSLVSRAACNRSEQRQVLDAQRSQLGFVTLQDSNDLMPIHGLPLLHGLPLRPHSGWLHGSSTTPHAATPLAGAAR